MGSARDRPQGAAGERHLIWAVVVEPGAAKTLRRLSKGDRDRLGTAIKQLPAGDVRRLQGGPRDRWRLRVGDWRVIFSRDDAARAIRVLKVSSRGDAYKR